jgi:hypothetical protein
MTEGLGLREDTAPTAECRVRGFCSTEVARVSVFSWDDDVDVSGAILDVIEVADIGLLREFCEGLEVRRRSLSFSASDGSLSLGEGDSSMTRTHPDASLAGLAPNFLDLLVSPLFRRLKGSSLDLDDRPTALGRALVLPIRSLGTRE